MKHKAVLFEVFSSKLEIDKLFNTICTTMFGNKNKFVSTDIKVQFCDSFVFI